MRSDKAILMNYFKITARSAKKKIKQGNFHRRQNSDQRFYEQAYE